MLPDARPLRPLQLFVVSHTHWDREWYLPAGRFRQRLVALVDELLAEEGAGAAPFLLDGQAVVLEDYLAVRPEKRDVLAEHLRDGSIEAGPWYVLADELIPSGEALVRNLLAGRATLHSFGAHAPPVLYSPDSFGHPAALPLLAAGFGFPLIVLWRGYGGPAWPDGDVFRWQAADGSEVLVYHLSPDGYELGSSLPQDEGSARDRWTSLRATLTPRSTLGVALLPNGADHHARQPRIDYAIAMLARVASPETEVRRSSLTDFARELVSRASGAKVPEIGGDENGAIELRNSYGYTWALQGTFGARAQSKRRNAFAERLFIRDMEPWVVLAKLHERRNERDALVRAAWKALLLCHPHDTLCGCSVDEVARAMSARLDDAIAQGTGLRDDALLDIADHDPVHARLHPSAWRPMVLVRNPAARARGGVAELEVLSFREHVRVGPGSAVESGEEHLASGGVDRPAAKPYTLQGGRVPYQILGRNVRHDRVESPLSYPHDDLVDSDQVVAWLPPVSGYGLSALSIEIDDGADAAIAGRHSPPAQVRAGDHWLDNGLLRVGLDDDGTVRLEARELDIVQESLISFEDVGDVGDLYTHSPRPPLVNRATFAGARLVHAGPLRGELHANWNLAIPEASTRTGRSAVTRELAIEVALTLDAAAGFLRVRVSGENQCRDHRLRVVFHTGLANAQVWADAAFGPVHRTPVTTPPSSAELAPGTAPLGRYVTLSSERGGATLYSDGLAEYEASASGDIAVTLVRAVGELSRNDLPERPGHAGWPAPTPEAQSLGAFEARFAVLPHRTRGPEEVALIERVADDALLPLTGSTLRSALALPSPVLGVELLSGDGEKAEPGGALTFSSCKSSEDGAWIVLRCVNPTDLTLPGRWRLGVPIGEAHLARIDETPSTALSVKGGEVEFIAAPRAVVTVLVRVPNPSR